MTIQKKLWELFPNLEIFDASLTKVLEFTTSITYDIKAFSDEVHLALTGAASVPVLCNAEYIGRFAREKRWEYRILVIPKINEEEIDPLCSFVADIDAKRGVFFWGCKNG